MGFELKKLGELCTKITDGSHYSPKEVVDGIPMYSVKDMTAYGFSDKSVKRISAEEYESLVKADCTPKVNDVLIAKDGSVLKHVFAIESEFEGALLSSIAILRPDTNQVEPDFLVYALQDPILRNDVLSNYVSGSGVPRIVLKDFKNISIRTPGLSLQKSISKLLKALDRKIQVNTAISQSLEDLAQSIFKSWFIDFDPVKAKIAGEKPVGMEDATAALFPDSLQESVQGLIPSGWSVSGLDTFAKQRKTLAKAAALNSSTNYVGLEHLPRNSLFFRTWGDAEKVVSTKAQFEKNDILFGKLRPYFHKVAVAPVDGVCSTDIVVIQNCEGKADAFTSCLVSSKEFINFVSNRASGTRMPRTTWGDMCDYKIAYAGPEIINRFNEILEPLFELALEVSLNSNSLEEIRDYLLPRLMSEELQIPDALEVQ